MSTKRNFYEILNATPSATTEELKINYKNLILQCHPDKLQQQKQQQQTNGDNNESPSSSKAKTINLENNDPNYWPLRHGEDKDDFQAITEAWNCLKDPVKRKRYDAELLLNKFHTHSNIYAHIQLKDMKKCPNTEFELELNHQNGCGEEEATIKGMESDKNNDDCHALPPPPSSYIYTYDCRCGGQYIVDESAEQYCRSSGNGSRSTGAASTGGGGSIAFKNDTKETTEGVNDGDGDEHNNGDHDDDDDDGELIVECSECSLVIILNG
ncbi:diphthamide biosynthesis 4 [Musca autumnalis]|uniref:diphthamide biosynthesis 4 n=1 Tax=Musca autumnalis TaxID=221902 RepID=UPI003CE7C5A8